MVLYACTMRGLTISFRQLFHLLLYSHRQQAEGGDTRYASDRAVLLEEGELGVWHYGSRNIRFHVRITDLERSVCDAVKYRNKLGLDVCAEVIRSYLRKPNRNLTRLQDYAQRLRVFNTLKIILK